ERFLAPTCKSTPGTFLLAPLTALPCLLRSILRPFSVCGDCSIGRSYVADSRSCDRVAHALKTGMQSVYAVKLSVARDSATSMVAPPIFGKLLPARRDELSSLRIP